MTSTVSPLARELRRLRAEKGLPMRALASRAGVSTKTIHLIETGKQRPSAVTIAKLARGLGIPSGLLLGMEEATDAPKAHEPLPLDAWGGAVYGARSLRETGRARMDGLLTAWREAKERGDAPAVREALDGIAALLQEAHEAERALWGASVPPTDEWITETREASRTYGELVGLVEGAGLRVHRVGRIEVEEAA